MTAVRVILGLDPRISGREGAGFPDGRVDPRVKPEDDHDVLLPRDPPEIRHGQRRRAELVQQPQAVGAQCRIGVVDGDLVEEGIDRRAQFRQLNSLV